MAGRRCLDCPRVIPAGSYRGRCPDCRRAQDRARGGRTARGYGASVWPTPLGTMTYDQARAAYQARMDHGHTYTCSCGCGTMVDPTAWHLAHSPDRTALLGPATPDCNLRDAGRASAAARRD